MDDKTPYRIEITDSVQNLVQKVGKNAQKVSQKIDPSCRPDKNTYYLNMALQASTRSTCLVAHYGVIIVKNDEIISTGFNGAAREAKHCLDLGCKRDETGISRYNHCRSVHAEENGLIGPSSSSLEGATLYLARGFSNGKTREVLPCLRCKRLLLNARIEKVVALQEDGEIHVVYPNDWVEEV